jgi:hypothetical protein
MARDEQEAGRSLDGASEDGALQEHIAHWVEVLDTWVKRVDLGMGRKSATNVGDGDGATHPDGDGLDQSLPHSDDGAGMPESVEG